MSAGWKERGVRFLQESVGALPTELNRNVGIGINYSHVSNADLKLPNLGRDFIQFRVEVPFN